MKKKQKNETSLQWADRLFTISILTLSTKSRKLRFHKQETDKNSLSCRHSTHILILLRTVNSGVNLMVYYKTNKHLNGTVWNGVY